MRRYEDLVEVISAYIQRLYDDPGLCGGGDDEDMERDPDPDILYFFQLDMQDVVDTRCDELVSELAAEELRSIASQLRASGADSNAPGTDPELVSGALRQHFLDADWEEIVAPKASDATP